MLVKVAEAEGAILDWMVAKCEGDIYSAIPTTNGIGMEFPATNYCTDWAQGGPIIEREHIGHDWRGFGEWEAWDDKTMPAPRYRGPTPLVAAMRCLVVSRLGEEVEVPDGLS